MVLRRFFSRGLTFFDWHNKGTLHCNGFKSLDRTTTFSNSHFFSIPFSFFWHFSLRSLPTLPFSEFPFLWKLKFFSAKPTVFRRLRRLKMLKRIRPKVKVLLLLFIAKCMQSRLEEYLSEINRSKVCMQDVFKRLLI